MSLDTTTETTDTPAAAAQAVTPTAQAKPTYGYATLARQAIVPSLTNPRTHFEPKALADLAATIKADGILQPLLVRPLPAARLQETFTDRRKGDPLPTHEVVAGERRYRAAGIAGVDEIPVLIRELDDATVLRMQVIENVERESLHPLEEANGYRRILDLPDQAELTMEQRVAAVAGAIKKSTRYVYQTLQLLKLCDFAQQVFLEGKLLRSVAVQIASIGNEAQQIEATRRVAGLARTGKSTEVVDNPMSQREAQRYITSTFRLVLAKAPFPIDVEFAGAQACTRCPSMSANARDLFDEGDKVPDTCLDPSCYGRKSTAQAELVAKAARAQGQRVITGKEARKIIPYESSPDHVNTDEYWPLDKKVWMGVDDKHAGKTVAQLLGTDIPKPVLIQRADGKGFVEALPSKDVQRLLKDRGLAKTVGVRTGKSESEIKAEREAAARKTVAGKLLERAAAGVDLPEAVAQLQATVATAPAHAALLSQLMPWIGARLYADMSDDQARRVAKLLPDWGLERQYSPDKAMQYVEGLDAGKFNQLVIAILIASETHKTEYYDSGLGMTTAVGTLLGLDVNAELKAAIADQVKTAKEQAAKKTPAAKKVAPVKTTPGQRKSSAAAKKQAAEAPALAPAEKGTKNDYAPNDQVQILVDLRATGGQIKPTKGLIGKVISKQGDRAWMLSVAVKGFKQTLTADYTELLPAAPLAAPEPPRGGPSPSITPQQAWPFPPKDRS